MVTEGARAWGRGCADSAAACAHLWQHLPRNEILSVFGNRRAPYGCARCIRRERKNGAPSFALIAHKHPRHACKLPGNVIHQLYHLAQIVEIAAGETCHRAAVNHQRRIDVVGGAHILIGLCCHDEYAFSCYCSVYMSKDIHHMGIKCAHSSKMKLNVHFRVLLAGVCAIFQPHFGFNPKRNHAKCGILEKNKYLCR